MAGRKPNPSHLKLLKGNPGRRPINKREPSALEDKPKPPSWLPERARKIFVEIAGRLEEMGYASSSHNEALALMALRLYEVEKYTEDIEKGGITIEHVNMRGSTVVTARPEVALRSEAARHAQSLLAEFGLTPSAATKIVVPTKQKKNKFAAL